MEWIEKYPEVILYIAAAVLLLIFYIRQKRRIRTFLLGGASGVSVLVLLHFFGNFIGFAPTLCLYNIVFSAILGIPGVALLYLGELFFS